MSGSQEAGNGFAVLNIVLLLFLELQYTADICLYYFIFPVNELRKVFKNILFNITCSYHSQATVNHALLVYSCSPAILKSLNVLLENCFSYGLCLAK